ncbi:MAG TPA: LamG-like jellyroll fold domain-containing protein [Gemmataceae bacterium]|jgi:hypothetical protein|nr:LamG-like jellyroll fold domain-containing protein [Gemmataceae bacterium]
MRRILSIITLLILPAFLLGDEPKFRAGVATIDITPEKFPVIVNGMFTERIANSAIDRLHARALVMEDGKTKIAIVVVDSLMMPREFLDKAKELAGPACGIPVENMCISATHTHSAPSVMGCLGSDPDPVYPEFLQRQIVRSITQAAKNTVPAKAGWAVTHAPKHTFNRRWILRSDKIRNDPFGQPTVRANMHPGYQNEDFIGPSGPVDDALTLLALRAQDDTPLAVLANFSMHYFGSQPVSADYFGLFCDKLGQRIGAKKPPWVAMSQGTSGDSMWMDYGNPKSDMTIGRYATELSDIAFEAYRNIEFYDDINLEMKETKLTLNRRVPDEKRLAWAKVRMAALGGTKPTEQADIYAREAIFLHEEPKRELKLQAIKIGRRPPRGEAFVICAIPNEVFAITGLRLKNFNPSLVAEICVVELANGAEGYIPPPEQHHLGGYTTWPARTAALEEEAEPKIAKALTKSVERLSGVFLIEFVTTGYTWRIVLSSPLGYWKFEEFGGQEATDRVYKHNGVFEVGVARYHDGKINACVHFAGGRMKADLKDLGPTYTAEFFFWNGFPSNVRPVTGYMFSRGSDGDKQAAGDHLGIGGTAGPAGKLIFFNGNDKNQTLAGKTDLKLKEWYHVALVRDGKKVTVYLNGKEEIAGEAENTVPEKSLIFFGGRCDKFAGFEGKIDEAAIFNRALPAEEIAKHFAAAK